jgi:hypothetical protein
MNTPDSNTTAAKRCPPDWHVAQSTRDGTYYCAPNHPDAALGQGIGYALAIPIAIAVMYLLRGGRRKDQPKK